MKKLLLALIVSLALCGSAFAQTSHWPDFDANTNNPYEDQAGLVAAIIIDGEPITIEYEGWDALEIAAFVGDACRANLIYLNDEFVQEFGDPYPTTWGDAIFFTTPGENLSFKMYDPSRDIEYTFVTALQYGEPLTLLTGDDHFEGWDNPDDVIFLSFTTPTFDEYIWNVTEPGWTAPEDGADVIIPDNSIVTIPFDCIAIAGVVTLGTSSQIIIEDGGQFYHSNEVVVSMKLDVDGYSSKDNAGYRLIAPGVHSTLENNSIPVAGTGLNQGTFDLYYFDESVNDNLPWINYEQNESGTIGFEELTLGQGYLYANAITKNAVLRGYTLPTVGTYGSTIDLTYTSGNTFAGWNLVGNPFTCNAYVKNGAGYAPYYELNSAGDGLNPTVVPAGTAFAPMKGIFVQATAEDNSCIFTTEAPSKGSNLNITVNQNNAMVDNAIVSFGYGSTLEKLQFNPNRTKVYMPVDGKDYAVAKADSQGEMPVSFKAQENGTYTLGFNAQNVEFSYLHLIDNMTGNDVDLLENPSYSFDASTTDYTSRFKLVFATGTDSSESNFGFISDGNLMILGIEGEATLQIIDVTGRILSTETFNGSYSKAVNEATGVYMLRLIQGNDVKTQKIVVK